MNDTRKRSTRWRIEIRRNEKTKKTHPSARWESRLASHSLTHGTYGAQADGTHSTRTHTYTDWRLPVREKSEGEAGRFVNKIRKRKKKSQRNEKRERRKKEREIKRRKKKKKNSDRIPPHGFLSHTHLCCSLALVRRFSSFSPFWRFVGKRKGADEERIAKRWKKKGLK